MEGDSLEAEMGSRKKRDLSMAEFSEFLSDTMSASEGQDYGADYEHDYEHDNDLAEIEEQPTYDDSVDINHFEASGKYTLDLIGQRRLLRRQRRATVNHLELPEATESTLMAHIDHSE